VLVVLIGLFVFQAPTENCGVQASGFSGGGTGFVEFTGSRTGGLTAVGVGVGVKVPVAFDPQVVLAQGLPPPPELLLEVVGVGLHPASSATASSAIPSPPLSI